MKKDIQKYLKWYNVNGFFFDETQADAASVTYYTNIANYVRSLKATYLVVLNPGVIPTNRTYFDFADLVSNLGAFINDVMLLRVDDFGVHQTYANTS